MPSLRLSGTEQERNSTLEPIAICGMACRLPGGVDSDSSFWQMLVEKRTGQTPKVPASRFNIDAHYHENLERPGSFNVLGGYFLDGRPQDFDPSFFNITPVEAQWLDPQQRKILEVSYECMVSAGVTLDAVSGSNTAVFVGSFTADYQQMSTREPDFRHNYAATGVDPGIISNRIGHTFNLRGPSFTINTACSSSIYALHNACHALRGRDCDAAIVGGVNLILTVDQHMNTAKLGILSPTSTCHTFDAAADGYGRAEAAGALYIKRLSDAIRDGDPIRGVIRSTAVNTNGKVDGMGITHPSVEGQERVLRMAYEKAGLNQNLTAYAELHGTGTPVGDPIEVRAVSKAMNDTRPKSKPLLIGALKPNIGHSEAASGIFAVMKAALMTEAAVIPGVALLERLNPAILEKEWNVKVHRDTAPWPSDFLVRRASVSSFGYGGTNGHVIVESIESMYPLYQHGKAKKEAPYDHSYGRPLLLTHSAHDKTTLSRNVAALAKVANNYYLADLVHTLNLHRTRFKTRAFAVAREESISRAFEMDSLTTGAVSQKKEVGFLFTGQGAQWVGMGKEAYLNFPGFADTIRRLDLVLSRLDPAPEFSIAELLLDDKVATVINEAHVAQPLCTTLQIALVDIFALWGVTPRVSVGHSSGEIAAAYAAGLISAPEAILAAFLRGRAVQAKSSTGSMLAVGLGSKEVRRFLPPAEDPGNLLKVCIACENSPNSVTLSGEVDEIARIQRLISSESIFARELKTGRAYHSPHMNAVGDFYEEILANAVLELSEEDLGWRRPRSHMVSSVTGEPITTEGLPKGYFSANLRNTVRFNTAVERIGVDKEMFSQVGQFVEIGPHTALSGPFRQICQANKFDGFTYIPSLARNKNSVDQILSAAGHLFVAGYPVNLEAVNAESYYDLSPRSGISNIKLGDTSNGHKIRKPKTEYLLVDLPPYQWNYEKEYWIEPRASAELRARMFPRHDLLGSRISGLSGRTRVWRNVLRHRDVPWLKHHSLGGTAIFPAAGHLAVAIEALRQVHEEEGLLFEGASLRDVAIDKALALPDNDDGVEIVITLQLSGSPSACGRHTFSVESLSNGEWALHCTGSVSAAQRPAIIPRSPVDISALNQRATGKTWYEAFRRVGFNYGPNFQQLQYAQTDRNLHHAAGNVVVLGSCMDGESRSLIHPSTVDACLQLIIVSIHAGRHKKMPWGVVPTHIEEATIFPIANLDYNDAGLAGHAVAWTDRFEPSGRRFNTHTILTGKNGDLLVHIKNLTCTAYEAAIPASTLQAAAAAPPPQPFSLSSWKPDIATLTTKDFEKLWPQLFTRYDRFAKFLELISHWQPLNRVLLICGYETLSYELNLNALLDTLLSRCAITLALCAPLEAAQVDVPEKHQGRVAIREISSLSSLWEEAENVKETHDLVLLDLDSTLPLMDGLVSLVDDGGWIIGSGNIEQFDNSLSRPGLQIDQEFALRKLRTDAETNTSTDLKTNSTASVFVPSSLNDHDAEHTGTKKVTVLSLELSEAVKHRESIENAVATLRHQISRKLLSEFDPIDDSRVVIDDTAGLLLFSGIDETNLAALKSVIASGVPIVWLTRGVRQGRNPTGGMAEGFLRVIRSEQAAARVILLDIDETEHTQDVAEAIIRCLDSACTKDSGKDTEFWLHRGVVYIARVYPNSELNQQWNEETTAPTGPQVVPLPTQEPLEVKALNNNVIFTSTHELHAHENGAPTNGVADIPTPVSESEANVLLPESASLRLSGDATYLLVGCLGGLGRSLTRFMMEHGAKHFAFLSRSGTDRPEAARVVESIRSRDVCSAEVFRVDGSEESKVREVVLTLNAQRPIRGVVHAAMVLRDGIFDTMDSTAFNAAVAPKARGAIALHHALRDTELDFFVMTSSISAILGNTGQSNYSAANSCLDALALHRNMAGLAGTSLVLPMVLDVGVVAEDDSDAIETSLLRKGMYGIDEEEMLHGFEVAMLAHKQVKPEVQESQLIMGMDVSELAKAIAKAGGVDNADVYWYRDARFTHVRASLEAVAADGSVPGSGQEGSHGDKSFTEALKMAEADGPKAVLEAIATHIAKRVSSILMIPLEDFELEGRSISSYGLDSMIGAEMRTWLFREFGLDFPFQKLLAPTLSLMSLAALAGEAIGAIKES
ncbi:ketoacyl-synt-domain-containing protein [Hypoxylon sp. NC0597]|nr:ketoacyl-synt-domain-containing protein [Hypoxylon sp. NC0597]